MVTRQNTISGTVLEEDDVLSLGELARACSVHAEYVVELVEHGVVDPLDPNAGVWHFRASCLVRVRKAVTLQADLHVNLPGVALALQLLDELDQLHGRLQRRPGGEY